MGVTEPMTEATEAPSTAVVKTVAAAEEWEDPATLTEPLYETIDPDALDALVESIGTGWITFTYLGYEVTVDADGSVSLAE